MKTPSHTTASANPRLRGWRIPVVPLLGAIGLLAVAAATAAPQVGYIYPAGGQTGTTFEVELGGQGLNEPIGTIFSGEGVTAEVIHHHKLPSAQVVSDYRDRLREIRSALKALPQGPGVEAREILPEVIDLLASVDLTEENVMQIEDYGRRRNDPKRQLNNQIAESVRIRVTIDSDAEPGPRFCRIRTERGLSNPLRFEVGDLIEFREPPVWRFDLLTHLGIEFAATETHEDSVIRGTFAPPATLNGQILPGEVDEFAFDAEEGQKIVVSVQARSLVPYLADAVPGWFQAVVSLVDPRGRELAFSDDYRYHPDPVLFYKIPRTGTYRLRIHDSIYRGREDFVYRIHVGELPFLTGISPLGGRVGSEVNLVFSGGNLTEAGRERFVLPETAGLHPVTASGESGDSNPVHIHVDSVAEEDEREENDRLGAANRLELPSIVNGIIDERGDEDFYRIEGRGNRPATFEVFARRLGSPIDSGLVIYDDDGRIIAENDDFENPASGLTTHHADARVTIKLPADGICFIKVAETQGRGGADYNYRLKVSQGPPDVAMRVTPSSAAAPAGGAARLTVHALRIDGFEGEIELALKNPPKGFALRNNRIGAGEESAQISLSVPGYPTDGPVEIELEAYPIEEGENHGPLPVLPAEDMTQAFITKHIVPVDALLIDVRRPVEKTSGP